MGLVLNSSMRNKYLRFLNVCILRTNTRAQALVLQYVRKLLKTILDLFSLKENLELELPSQFSFQLNSFFLYQLCISSKTYFSFFS